jgi:hypothetical protein
MRSGIAAVVVSLTLCSWLEMNDAVALNLQNVVEQKDNAVEVFQVLDLPLNITHVTLSHAEKGNFLKCTLANNSERQILGLRYILLLVDQNNRIRTTITSTEGLKLPGYDSKTFTLSTPIKLKLKSGDHLELMLEQVVGEESIWEVVKARDALEAYVSGDYSVMPQVLRVSNQVDVPLPLRVRVIY